MYIHGCTNCDHEWESVEIKEEKCSWCGAFSHNLGSVQYWEKMNKTLKELVEKLKK